MQLCAAPDVLSRSCGAGKGVDGLLRDKNRPPGRKRLATAVIERVVALTAEDPPGETTH